jgi:lysyl-tRNA synthetase class 2
MSREDRARSELQRTLLDLESTGVDPYPHMFKPTISTVEARERYVAAGVDLPDVSLTGRIMGLRRHRTATFADLEDDAGRLQVRLVGADLSTNAANTLGALTLGDIVGVTGTVSIAGRGEITLTASDVRMLAKCLRPLPDRRHSLSEGQGRHSRHLRLLTNRASREALKTRASAISAIRGLLESRDFIEVETPILQPVYGGAEAEPFVTHVNALGRDMYLRIAPELYLKRLLVGGLPRVFEIGKNFRNEGMSARHHPEFSALEAYQAGADYQEMMRLTEAIFTAVSAATGTVKVESHLRGFPVAVDLTPPFRRLSVLDSLREFAGVDIGSTRPEDAIPVARRLDIDVPEGASAADAVMALFERFVEPNLHEPTFVTDYPAELCPLTKRHRAEPWLAERFELYVDGTEIANAYSELNDPREQRRQFEAQVTRRERGDLMAHLPDWDFVEALEYGMPPAGGLGVGIDRLVMLITGAAHIQDVITFPLRR